MRKRVLAVTLAIAGMGLTVTGSMVYAQGRHAPGIIWILCGIVFLAIGVWRVRERK
jgi:hypothetical protein